jgi:hypothetical protein
MSAHVSKSSLETTQLTQDTVTARIYLFFLTNLIIFPRWLPQCMMEIDQKKQPKNQMQRHTKKPQTAKKTIIRQDTRNALTTLNDGSAFSSEHKLK